MDIRKEIKMLAFENGTSITEIAREMSKVTGKHYSQSNLSQKLMRKTLKFEEAKIIGSILGYELKYVRTKSYMQ